MLNFFRKYQKIFFLLITIVTITSFIFFGTYQAMAPIFQKKEETVFRTLNGKSIKRSTFSSLCEFLSNENPIALIPYQRKIGNFLNEGVLSKDFLESGLIYSLFERHQAAWSENLSSQLQREKEYRSYVHTSISFIAAEKVWSLFAPQISTDFATLKNCDSNNLQNALKAKVSLYLAERQFPPALLTQILRYQEKENPSIPQDPRLYREDISLFGYKSLQDWFGAPFIENAAKIILNGAAFARQQGFSITHEEIVTSLMLNCQKAFQALPETSRQGVSSQDFMRSYLRNQQLDEETLVFIWGEILLFRRMMSEIGTAPFIDVEGFKDVFSKAGEYATVEVLAMQPEFRLQNLDDLNAFEAYIGLVATSNKSPLDVPSKFDETAIIEKRAPFLVGCRYELEVAEVSKKQLQAKVTALETWNWETDESNWKDLANRFPEFFQNSGMTLEERIKALDALNPKQRLAVDRHACKQIVDQHPEWLQEALANAPLKEKKLFLRKEHAQSPLPGISNAKELRQVLDEQSTISSYSQDQEIYYRFLMKSKGMDNEVLSFAEAKKEGLLNKIPVDSLAVVKALYKDAVSQGSLPDGLPENEWGNLVAPYRFVSFLRQNREGNAFFKLVKKQETIVRSTPWHVPFERIIALEPLKDSPIEVSSKEGAFFYRLIDKKINKTLPLDKFLGAQEILSSDAKKYFFSHLLEKIDQT